MSARSTTTPSRAHRYCCFRREPQLAWSRLDEMPACACVAEYNLTGMETIPKLTVSEANARAAMPRLLGKWAEDPPQTGIVPKCRETFNYCAASSGRNTAECGLLRCETTLHGARSISTKA